jgi:hypothetical protein
MGPPDGAVGTTDVEIDRGILDETLIDKVEQQLRDPSRASRNIDSIAGPEVVFVTD